jgi:putative transposase
MYVIQSFGLSQRRASGLIGLNRNTLRHEPKQDKDGDLRKRMKELAEQRRRFGCRRLHVLLRREGLVDNHKKTERIYRQEKLALRIRRRKKLASQGRIEISKADKANELWAMDFLHDVLYNGRKLRFLPIIDTYTKECFRIEVDTSIGGKRVCTVLSQIAAVRGLPENIVVDNGPEFISNALDAWAYERGVKLHFIRPGKPVDNAYMESFNGKFRDECLNLHWFMNVGHARAIAEDHRLDYNNERPHSSLGNLTPVEFMRLEEERAVGIL